MLLCTEISFVIYFNYEKFGVKPGFPPPPFFIYIFTYTV